MVIIFHQTLSRTNFPLDGMVSQGTAYMACVQMNLRMEVRNHASRKWILNCFKLCCRLHFSAHTPHGKDREGMPNTTFCVLGPCRFRTAIAIGLSWNAGTTIRSRFDGYLCLDFGFVQGANAHAFCFFESLQQKI